MPWYALKVRAAQEKKVAHRIANELERLGLSHWVSDIVVPMERVLTTGRGGKKQEKEKVFMPGYLFLEVPSESFIPDLIPIMRSVADVLYFVAPSRGASPEPLSEQEIAPILSRARAKEPIPEALQNLEVGQTVRVIDGPFAGLEGAVAEVFPEKQRARILIKIFNREAPVEIQYHQIERL